MTNIMVQPRREPNRESVASVNISELYRELWRELPSNCHIFGEVRDKVSGKVLGKGHRGDELS